jgi:hypothetical protein
VFVVFCLVAAAGCASRRAGVSIPQEAEIAVAGFTQPEQSWQYLSGYAPDRMRKVEPRTLEAVNRLLLQELEERGKAQYCKFACVSQCREVVLHETEEGDLTGLKYWTRVGRCVPADYLLVPQLLHWQERVGGEWGVKQPAKVVLDLFLIDVKNGAISGRYHFDREQESLSENLLNIGSFFKRGGKWVKATDLAEEGIAQGLEEVGL